MQSAYLETTIPSYLTAWPSSNLVMAAHQAITREWWETQRHRFELFTSQLVIEEAMRRRRDCVGLAVELTRNDYCPCVHTDGRMDCGGISTTCAGPAECNRGRVPYRLRVGTRYGLPSYIELSAYRKRGTLAGHRQLPATIGAARSHRLHARRGRWEILMKRTTHSDDTILREIHETRRRLLEEHGGIAGLAAYLRDQEAKSNRKIMVAEPSSPAREVRGTRQDYPRAES